jgi:hypothetical protein
MNSKRWLVSWIGKTDHDCAEGRNGGDLGPIASAIKALPSFDRIHLLTNYEHHLHLAIGHILLVLYRVVLPKQLRFDR